jgi:hypothetical protein
MNAEKVLFSTLLLSIVVIALVTASLLVVTGVNSGTLWLILGPVSALLLLYGTYKLCGFLCRIFFHKKKAT